MQRIPHLRRWVVASTAAGLAAMAMAASATEDGWIGLGVRADGEGRFWNPLLRSLTVSEIETGSPAAASRIAIGDRIVAVAGVTIAGQRLRKLAPHFEVGPGESLILLMQGGDGVRYTVELTAAKAPPR